LMPPKWTIRSIPTPKTLLNGGANQHRRIHNNLLQEKFPLQGERNPLSRNPRRPKMNKKEERNVDDLSSPLDTNKRHSQVSAPPKAKIAKEVEVKSWALIFSLTDETEVTRFADHHIADRLDADGEAFTVERVAE
jgi:hypothetical protein